MASNAPPHEIPLTQRLANIAQTLQFAWFVGHLSLLATTFRYTLAIVKFNSNTRIAAFSYRLAFLSAAATYGIVVYKAYRARLRSGQLPTGQQGALKILGDENVQYLLMALTWLYSKPVYIAMLPFAVYSTFHFLTYLRTNLIPAVMPAAPPTAANPNPTQPAVSEAISKFVKKNYDGSMHLVAQLELFLWLRVFVYCLIFKNSWVLLFLYTVFLRARYSQSQFVKDALLMVERRGDALVGDAKLPDGVRMGWGMSKNLIRQFGEVTDVTRYVGAPPVKKES